MFVCHVVNLWESKLVYLEMTPVYFYLLVGGFIFDMFVSAKFLERYLASEAENSSAAFFRTAGTLIGIIVNAAVFAFIPAVHYCGPLFRDMQIVALMVGMNAECASIDKGLASNPTQQTNYEKAFTELTGLRNEAERSSDELQVDIQQFMQGQAIFYKWSTGRELPTADAN